MTTTNGPPNGAVLRPWTIKAMPEELTQRAVAAARRRQETVAELVSRALARELDGPSVVMRSDQIEPSKPASEQGEGRSLTVVGAPRSAPVDPRSDPRSDQVGLRDLVEMARALTPPEKDSEAMRLARSMVRDRLRALRMGSA
jgi:hypothetical protein